MTFDRCDVRSSLLLGASGKALIYGLNSYRLSYPEAELTTFLSKKVMERGEATGKQVIVACSTERKATHKNASHLQSDHEEADTRIILHALDATADVATKLSIYSLDTAINHYLEMCSNTSFVTRYKERTRRIIKLQPIVEALGSAKTAALPAFHALTGADNTGSFSGRGKPTC